MFWWLVCFFFGASVKAALSQFFLDKATTLVSAVAVAVLGRIPVVGNFLTSEVSQWIKGKAQALTKTKAGAKKSSFDALVPDSQLEALGKRMANGFFGCATNVFLQTKHVATSAKSLVTSRLPHRRSQQQRQRAATSCSAPYLCGCSVCLSGSTDGLGLERFREYRQREWQRQQQQQQGGFDW